MFEQLSLLDMMQSGMEVPRVNIGEYIPASQLQPIQWEAWKYSNSEWTLLGGKPYIIDAFVALLPGNRIYVKEWMLYPFMFDLGTSVKAEKQYEKLRQKIATERSNCKPGTEMCWKADKLPAMEDMWQYKDGEYSCQEYAEKILYGYQMGQDK